MSHGITVANLVAATLPACWAYVCFAAWCFGFAHPSSALWCGGPQAITMRMRRFQAGWACHVAHHAQLHLDAQWVFGPSRRRPKVSCAHVSLLTAIPLPVTAGEVSAAPCPGWIILSRSCNWLHPTTRSLGLLLAGPMPLAPGALHLWNNAAPMTHSPATQAPLNRPH